MGQEKLYEMTVSDLASKSTSLFSLAGESYMKRQQWHNKRGYLENRSKLEEVWGVSGFSVAVNLGHPC